MKIYYIKKLILLIGFLLVSITSFAFNVREVDLDDSWDIKLDLKTDLIYFGIFIGAIILLLIVGYAIKFYKFIITSPLEKKAMKAMKRNNFCKLKEDTEANYSYHLLRDKPVLLQKGERFKIISKPNELGNVSIKMENEEKYNRNFYVNISLIDFE